MFGMKLSEKTLDRLAKILLGLGVIFFICWALGSLLKFLGIIQSPSDEIIAGFLPATLFMILGALGAMIKKLDEKVDKLGEIVREHDGKLREIDVKLGLLWNNLRGKSE
jgi:bacteriorhodopsin